MIYFARGADYTQIGLVNMKMHQLIRDGLEQNGVDFVVLEKRLCIQLDCHRGVVDFIGDRLGLQRGVYEIGAIWSQRLEAEHGAMILYPLTKFGHEIDCFRVCFVRLNFASSTPSPPNKGFASEVATNR